MREEYVPLENPTGKINHLQVSVNYYKDLRVRGYYLCVMPAEIRPDGIVRVLLRSKHKLILEVSRKSDKAYAQALALCTPELKQEVMDALIADGWGWIC